jgi:hypothetical protein
VPQTVQFFLSLFIYYYHLIKNVALSQTCDTLQEQAIDMVLTDYCMPEMTGYDLLKAIKVLLPLLQCKICHRGIFCRMRSLNFCMCPNLTRCKLPLNFAGAEPAEADPCHRHVVRRRAPEDQPVSQPT